jgi:hypothetical protein
MCPINAKKIDDIKQVTKYTDHNHKDFWSDIEAWETTSKEEQDE